jgi:hypothetical protein
MQTKHDLPEAHQAGSDEPQSRDEHTNSVFHTLVMASSLVRLHVGHSHAG